jgi:hypothetical protein
MFNSYRPARDRLSSIEAARAGSLSTLVIFKCRYINAA